MSGYRERADRIVERLRAFDDDHDDAVEAHFALVNERLDESGLRGQVWGSMIYACRGGHEERIELEVGVEGPADWREDGTYLACAFGGPPCDECGKETTHVRWSEDEHFEPRAAETERVWRVPRERVRYAARSLDRDGRPIYSLGDSAFLSFDMDVINRRLAERSRA